MSSSRTEDFVLIGTVISVSPVKFERNSRMVDFARIVVLFDVDDRESVSLYLPLVDYNRMSFDFCKKHAVDSLNVKLTRALCSFSVYVMDGRLKQRLSSIEYVDG